MPGLQRYVHERLIVIDGSSGKFLREEVTGSNITHLDPRNEHVLVYHPDGLIAYWWETGSRFEVHLYYPIKEVEE